MSDTQDPRTGATPNWLEEALDRIIDLLPDGYVIARRADVITPEIRQAMKFAMFVIEAVERDAEDEWSTECFCEATHYAPSLDEENGTVQDHIDLIRAIAEGGTE